jgi:hypothetical protein
MVKCETCKELVMFEDVFYCKKLNHYMKGGEDMKCHSRNCEDRGE